MQASFGLDVEGLVDGLVADAHAGLVRVGRSACDLLGRPALGQVGGDLCAQFGVGLEFAGPGAPGACGGLDPGGVGAGRGGQVSPLLAPDRGAVASQELGDAGVLLALREQDRDLLALSDRQPLARHVAPLSPRPTALQHKRELTASSVAERSLEAGSGGGTTTISAPQGCPAPPVSPPPPTARGPPPGGQARGTAPLPPSPPDTVTTRTPRGRQRRGEGRRPSSSPPSVRRPSLPGARPGPVKGVGAGPSALSPGGLPVGTRPGAGVPAVPPPIRAVPARPVPPPDRGRRFGGRGGRARPPGWAVSASGSAHRSGRSG